MLKRVWLAWSSGKDSAWALHVLRQDPSVEVVGLLTTLNRSVDRVAMHGVRRDLLELQSERAGLPLETVPLPSPCSNEEYERLMSAAIGRARDAGVTHMAFGDLFLEDVRDYRIRQLSGTGIEPLFPVWGSPSRTRPLAETMIAAGMRAVITCVDTQQIDASLLGRQFDETLLRQLPASVDPCGERGEFHTCCYAGPIFERPIQIALGDVVAQERFHFIDVLALKEDSVTARALASP